MMISPNELISPLRVIYKIKPITITWIFDKRPRVLLTGEAARFIISDEPTSEEFTSVDTIQISSTANDVFTNDEINADPKEIEFSSASLPQKVI